MSFNQNDINNTINLGNYEEYFILYMDNELTPEQKTMVDSFLAVHPDLQAELDILLSTQLAPEVVSFDKHNLFADQMKLSSIEEDLLLYIDNELPEGEAKKLHLEIATQNDLQLQHQVLLQTKLDASEIISYPNKEELYRRTEKTIRFGVWMRVAAAVIVIASLGLVYLNSNSDKPLVEPQVASSQPVKKVMATKEISTEITPAPQKEENILASSTDTNKKKDIDRNVQPKVDFVAKKNIIAQDEPVEAPHDLSNNAIAYNDEPRHKANAIDAEPAVRSTDVTSSNHNDFINNQPVTSELLPRNTIMHAALPSGPTESVASNRKGSIRGLLRKATRVIEKTTGIDATDGDERLLIGALAVKL